MVKREMLGCVHCRGWQAERGCFSQVGKAREVGVAVVKECGMERVLGHWEGQTEMMHRAKAWCSGPGGWRHCGGLPWVLRPYGGIVEMGDGLD